MITCLAVASDAAYTDNGRVLPALLLAGKLLPAVDFERERSRRLFGYFAYTADRKEDRSDANEASLRRERLLESLPVLRLNAASKRSYTLFAADSIVGVSLLGSDQAELHVLNIS